MIKFLDIDLQNFSSYRSQKFSYREGLTLVQGENMSGKTNLFEALLWCLFEECVKEKNVDGARLPGHKVDSVVNSESDDCSVSVRFESEDGQLYTVLRERNRKGSSSLSILTNGNTIKQKSKADTQETVESIIGSNYSTFVQTVLFGQGTRRFTQARDSERKAIMEQLLELGVYSYALDAVKSKKKEVLEYLNDYGIEKATLEVEIKQYSESIDRETVVLEEQSTAYSAWQKDLEEKKEVVRKCISTLKKRHAQELLKLKRELLQRVSREKSTENFEVEDDTPFLQRQAVLQSRLKELDKQESLVGKSKCPTCDSKLTEQKIETLNSNREIQYSEFLEELKKIKSKLKKIRDQEKKKSELERSYEDQKAVCVALDEKITSIESQTKSEKEKLELLKMTTAPQKPNNSYLRELNRKVAECKQELKKINKALKNKKQEIEDLDFWEVGFGNKGIKSLIMDNVLPVLNSTANRYIGFLVDKPLTVEFDTESYSSAGKAKDVFDVRIKAPGGEGLGLASRGERGRIDFCVALALQKLLSSRGSETNLFILDEPFEGVDHAGQEGIVQLLENYVAESGKCVYVVSHMPRLKGMFRKTIEVTMNNGVSSVL